MATQKKGVAKKEQVSQVQEERATRSVPETIDPTDRLPSLPPVGVKSIRVDVTCTRDWYDNWQLRKEGERYIGTFAADEDGDPIFPTSAIHGPLVVHTEDYIAPIVDLPGTSLDVRRRTGVRGGATGMPQL